MLTRLKIWYVELIGLFESHYIFHNIFDFRLTVDASHKFSFVYMCLSRKRRNIAANLSR